jgi:hypothetical protein
MKKYPATPSKRSRLGSISGIRAIILGVTILTLATSCSTTPQMEPVRAGMMAVSDKKTRPEAPHSASQKRADKPTQAGSSQRQTSRTKKALLEDQSFEAIVTRGHSFTARPEARQPSAPALPKLPPQTAQQSVVPSTVEATRPPQKTGKD